MTDWSKVKIRCSALGCLFTEPKLKSEKESGELSKTAKTFLIRYYIKERWGRQKELTTKYLEKGILAEESSLTLLSIVDGEFYVKNKEHKENDYVSGHADIVGDIVIDAKSSWDAETFLPKLIEPIDSGYIYQLQGYMWLWNLQQAKLSYCLVNTPESIINNERRKLLYSMDVATEEAPEYKEAVAELERNMIFDDIPESERVISHIIKRDEKIIEQIPAKVGKARKFLAEFEKLHLKPPIL